MKGKLTPRQKKFCDLYIIAPNGTKAYIDAGYKVKNNHVAEAAAERLLRNVEVEKYLTEKMEEKDKNLIMQQDEVLQRLTRIARGQEKQQYINSDGDSVVTDPLIKDQIKALELIGKRYRMFVDRVEQDNTETEKLEVSIKVVR